MKCKHVKPNKSKCKANAMVGKDCCFMHNPDTRKKLLEASRKGGKSNKRERRKLRILKTRLKTPEGIRKLLEETVVQLNDGKIDEKTANTVAYLSSNLMKALELKHDKDYWEL
ncbi:MAG: hypothetical protein KBC50_00185 [Candidatus Pacebacteria bacterium]|nr:hypothetical protein [Candidatus Paceibacterota bacterium]